MQLGWFLSIRKCVSLLVSEFSDKSVDVNAVSMCVCDDVLDSDLEHEAGFMSTRSSGSQ